MAGSLTNRRTIFWQLLVLALVAVGIGWLVSNTTTNLAARDITTGFGFLEQEAGFNISDTVFDYTPEDSYFRAIAVGLANTIKVSLLAILFATAIGTGIGLLSVSLSPVLQRFSRGYVELFRNIPLLLQLIFWYTLFTAGLPLPHDAYHPLPGVFVNNRGLYLPTVSNPGTLLWQLLAFGGLVWAGLRVIRRLQGYTVDTIGAKTTHYVAITGMLLAPLFIAGVLSDPIQWQTPTLGRFNFTGGVKIMPEFMALLVALSLYSGAFIAEVVRSGILAVPTGQWEAAQSLNLSRAQTLRQIILPQALRLVIPPVNSVYLNTIKNSSLAVAIGYPELVSVVNITINQTGQALEGIAIIMAAYLTINLAVSGLSNWVNSRL